MNVLGQDNKSSGLLSALVQYHSTLSQHWTESPLCPVSAALQLVLHLGGREEMQTQLLGGM